MLPPPRPGSPERPRPPQRGPAPAILAAALLLLYLARAPLLTCVAELLIVRDAPAASGLLFLLNGAENVRPPHAARLWRRGVAPRVAIAREYSPESVRAGLYPNRTDVAVGMLRRHGVPDSAIVVLPFPGGVTSTQDEGRALRAYLERHPARRVTVVTSDYHTARARWTIRQELRGLGVEVRMAAAPEPGFGPRDWWRSEEGLILYLEEYLKWAHTLLR